VQVKLFIAAALILLWEGFGWADYSLSADFGSEMEADGEVRSRVKGTASYSLPGLLSAALTIKYYPGDITDLSAYVQVEKEESVITVGHFYISAGSGLVLGKKSSVFKGIFNHVTPGGGIFRVIPEKSGSSTTAFRGVSIEQITRRDSGLLRRGVWYSNRQRYYTLNSEDALDISLSTLDGKLLPHGLGDSMVTRHDMGIHGGLYTKKMSTEISIHGTLVERRSLVPWRWDDDPLPGGRIFHGGATAYTEIKSRNIRLFLEGALVMNGFSNRDLSLLPALQGGIYARYRGLSLSFIIRSRYNGFYAPLSSLPLEADDYLEAHVKYSFTRNIFITTGYAMRYIHGEMVKQSRFFAGGEISSKKVTFALEGLVLLQEDISWKSNLRLMWKISKCCSMKIRGSVQSPETSLLAWSVSASLDTEIFHRFFLALLYSYVSASEGNGIYVSRLAVGSRGFHVDYRSSSGHSGSFKLSWKTEPFVITAGYSVTWEERGKWNHGVDLYCSMKLR
jgi:hypothetical protein